MAFLLQIIVFGILIIIGLQLWNARKGGGDGARTANSSSKTIEGTAEVVQPPGQSAADNFKQFETARAELKARYPAVYSMLSGALNAHAIEEKGSQDAAVTAMIDEWSARRGVVRRDLTKLLAENETEEECRAVVVAVCDAELTDGGYRAWLNWLHEQFETR
ncbi:MAG: hypothetical protein AAFW81_02770 [Pseudomonadota bacterium]